MDIKYTLNIVEKLLNIASPSGFTHQAIAYLEIEAKKLGYTTNLSPKGNLMITVEGKASNRVLGVSTHTDTLGLMVRSIKSDGKLAVTKIGGPIMGTLDGEYCRVYTRNGKEYTGTILLDQPSVHVYKDAESEQRNPETMEIRLDEMVKTKEDCEKLGISAGDFIAIDPKTIITPSGFIKSRFLDDKMSVAIMFGVLKQLKDEKLECACKTIFIVSTFEEVGHGSSWIPEEITELLAVDMGCIGLDLTCSEYDVSICAKDSSGPYDYELTSRLIELAKECKLNYAVDIYPYYSSDVSAALRGGNNIKGALIGPGVHASHGMERTHSLAVENTMKLLSCYLTK